MSMKTRNTAYWLCQMLGWGAFTLIAILATILSQGGVFSGLWIAKLLFNYAVFFVVIILLTHFLRREIRRRQWLSSPARKFVPRLAGASILVGLASALQVLALDAVTL